MSTRSITRGSGPSVVVGATANEGRAALGILVGGLLVGSYAMYKGATLLGVAIMGGSLLAGAASEKA